MKLIYYGHSCFSVMIGDKTLLFDPFITPNPLASEIDINSIDPDFILVSHGHADHIADCVAMASATQATVICSWEIHEWLGKQGITNTHPMNTGGKWTFDSFTVKCVSAQHSSGLPDGSYGGNPMGFIVMSKEGNFYYSGDTALTLDMQLIPRWTSLNFAVLPIGDNFTMDAADAVECASMCGSPQVIGVHYNTFDLIKIDLKEVTSIFNGAGITLHLPVIGSTIDL